MKATHGCLDYRSLPTQHRRSFLKVGALGSLGVTLANTLRLEAATGGRGKAKSVILLWLQGGVSHHESFDPKPDAADDIRGELSSIPTALPGVYFCDYLPKLAAMANKLAVIRSVTHSEAAHQRGSIYMVEGRRPSPATGVEHSGNPHLGSIVAHELGMRDGMPAYFSIPGNDFTSNFTGHGWLPGTSAGFRGVDSKALQSGGENGDLARRLALRGSLRAQMDRFSRQNAWDRFDAQAVDFMTSGKGATAFQWDKEPAAIRELYGLVGKNRDDMASLCITARRLVESGVRFVTVGRDSWDHHSNIFPQLRSRLPLFDAAFTGLVTDLEQRGLLDETLVVYLTEYGRTPKINKDIGRDHWPAAFSVAFAGAGIRAGQVIGASDKNGAAVTERPVTPEEIAATILHLVGIPPQTTFQRSDGRPIPYVEHAKPVQELLA